MNENYYAVIMAGGGGTRLWPLSRQAKPKQMLSLIDESTLFQMAVRRLSALFPPERILVVTNQAQSEELRQQCEELNVANFLLEPEPRGTAPAIALAALHLHQRDPHAVMAVLTADHYISETDQFIKYLQEAKEIALQGYLVTLGIDPTFAATQYGYIQQGAALSDLEPLEAFEVKRFKEKPDASEAEAMLSTGGHSWNSGMFVWQVSRIRAEFERQMPELHRALVAVEEEGDGPTQDKTLARHWAAISNQTIDYGIMEHAQQLAVIPVKNMGWNDVGSWNSLFDVLAPDAKGNVVLADKHLDFDSHNSLIHATEHRNDKERLVVTIGVEDLVVVDTGDVLLICSKARAQEVRQVIEQLKRNNMNEYL
ncbi:MAG: mannose-1-phosphate guanylyltransferase [Chloroflexi bacterium]|nr:mannose-1-phosphate guanylyltransferase [Chloroflexota bacterium]MQC26052.1 mannose-1-phosphate guanylyltransferase [Chloroflexota bacterium]